MGLCDGCPPFGGAICGITDTFDRPNAAALGTADCGRVWDVQLADPMSIDGNEMYVPTGIRGDRISSLPGNYPVPFNGRITASQADIHAGFTYVTTYGTQLGLGPAWEDNFGSYVDGTAAYTGIHEDPHTPGGMSPMWNRVQWDPDGGVTIAGHLKMVEFDSGLRGLDEYINIGIGFAAVINSIFLLGSPPGGTGDPAVAYLYLQAFDPIGGFASDVLVPFPANWWATVGECDFEITYSGGVGGTVTADFGGVSGSVVRDASIGLPGFSAGTGTQSFYDDLGPVPDGACAEMQISGWTINGNAITDINWEWRLNGTDSMDAGVGFRFGYISMGGVVPFNSAPPDFYDADPEHWPYNKPTPAVWIYCSSAVGGPLTIVPLGGDIAWPFMPVVTIVGTVVTLNIGGVGASVTLPFPLVSLDDTIGGLTHVVRNGQGAWAKFNNLDVVGVNLCIETGITRRRPRQFQEVRDEYVALGDGVTTGYSTDWPYIAGTLQVEVAGMLGELDSTDPATGAFELADPAPAGLLIRASYRVGALT